MIPSVQKNKKIRIYINVYLYFHKENFSSLCLNLITVITGWRYYELARWGSTGRRVFTVLFVSIYIFSINHMNSKTKINYMYGKIVS